MDKLLKKVQQNIVEKKLIENGDVIVLGLSAGPDSVFLLYCLIQLREKLKKLKIEYSLILAHINHGIRDEAVIDENLAKMYSQKYNIPIYIEHKNVGKIAKELKISEEECGRDIRYNFFDKIKENVFANKIAVAHNSNDNAETIIFNFMRGTGINGLCGMEYINKQGIIRPILNIKKEEILDFLDNNNVEYAVDKTNLENKYTRNKIRNELIQHIEEKYNPNIINTINKMSEILTMDKQIINEYIKETYKSIVINRKKGYTQIDRKKFNEANDYAKPYIIRKAVEETVGNTKDLEYIHVNDIIKLLTTGITGKQFIIGNKFEVKIEKEKKAFFIKR